MSDAEPALRVLAAGGGGTVQDAGRPGWRAFGVPVGGVLDAEALRIANRLLENPRGAPVLELCGGGQRFLALRPVAVALTGAVCEGSHASHRVLRLSAGEELALGRPLRGVWTVLGIRGGFAVDPWLGSASAYPRAGLGVRLRPGEELRAPPATAIAAGRFATPPAMPSADGTVRLRVWPGPQEGLFPASAREAFTGAVWRVSRLCDRLGYRLEGPVLEVPAGERMSEPQPVGAIQVARDGQPIVLMRDGPAVGGYPKIAILDPEDLSRLAQCAPSTGVRFVPAG